MEYIFHEKQDGSLCAQHCLNALLQGPYFTAVDLAALAVQLDEEERRTFDVGGIQASQNMNESGNFSIQVLSKALEIWSLELVPYRRQSPEAEDARTNPTLQRAFICNFREHWFTIRRLGDQWFDLNSTLSAPRLISPTYLTVYLAQLQCEGHSIFFVTGQLPDSEADRIITLCPVTDVVVQPSESAVKSSGGNYLGSPGSAQAAVNSAEDDISEVQIMQQVLHDSRVDEDERQLQRALELSIMPQSQSPYCNLPEEEEEIK